MSQSEAYTDVVELCALLQCLGFSVKSLDSSDGNLSQEGGARTVVINCQTSGLHVVLETPSANCSCPATNQQQNSGLWQISGVTGGKHLDMEFGCTLLGSLPKSHRDKLTKELHNIIRCIKQNDTDPGVGENKSTSLTELKTPEKRLFDLKSETPTRYRSLDTLTATKEAEQHLPTPGPLQRAHLISESSGEDAKVDSKRSMCRRQDTYTLPSSSPAGSIGIRNKTSSPIHAPQNSVLENLVEAEKAAEELRNKLGIVINEYMDQFKNDSSISSLALDVSKISVLKGAESSKPQFASSPNLSGIMAPGDFTKSRLKRFESASTSNLVPKAPKEGKMSMLRRISPNIFKKKESPRINTDKSNSQQDCKGKLNSLLRPKIVTPIRTYKPSPMSEPSPSLSTSSRKKYSHVKSTIPKPSAKK